ncbi:MAG: DUF222 domain-containing protein [Actinobacteria bacterium]|nr:DUF222 domain-containing protein [Actinomycetota bacterium]
MAVTATAASSSFFDVSRAAHRRARIRASLPTVVPAGFDEINDDIDALPDPELLCAEERAAAMAHTARLRNRIEAYLTGLAGAADTAGDSRVLGAGTTGSLVAIATGSPVAVGSGMVNTANALHDLPVVKDAWAAGSISGLHVYQILAHAPAIDDFTSKQAAIVGLAKLTDASEVRRVLQVAAEADNPTHLDLTLDQQRAKRSLRLSARANGMWAITGMLDEVDGAILAETLASFTRPPDTHDTTTPAQRRADALTDMSKAAAANTHPGGVSAVSILVDLENLPTSDNATLVDGTPLGAGSFDLLSCAAVCTVIFGIKRTGTFIPLALGRKRRRASAAQWAALIARDRGCIRCGRTPRHCHAHHIIHWKDGGRTDLSNLALLCSRCHNDLHHGRYTITMDTHTIPVITHTRGPP